MQRHSHGRGISDHGRVGSNDGSDAVSLCGIYDPPHVFHFPVEDHRIKGDVGRNAVSLHRREIFTKSSRVKFTDERERIFKVADAK